MADLDPVAWLDRHPCLSKFVLLPLATIACWVAMLTAPSDMWGAIMLPGVAMTTSLGLLLLLIRPCELFVTWFVRLNVAKLAVQYVTEVRDTLISHGLWKHESSKGKHAWDYMSWDNPVHVYSLQSRLANK